MHSYNITIVCNAFLIVPNNIAKMQLKDHTFFFCSESYSMETVFIYFIVNDNWYTMIYNLNCLGVVECHKITTCTINYLGIQQCIRRGIS